LDSLNRIVFREIGSWSDGQSNQKASRLVDYYLRTRTHLSLDKDCPHPRPIMPPLSAKVIAIPQVGGLHHRYERSLEFLFR
jgi:hypothetical protein